MAALSILTLDYCLPAKEFVFFVLYSYHFFPWQSIRQILTFVLAALSVNLRFVFFVVEKVLSERRKAVATFEVMMKLPAYIFTSWHSLFVDQFFFYPPWLSFKFWSWKLDSWSGFFWGGGERGCGVLANCSLYDAKTNSQITIFCRSLSHFTQTLLWPRQHEQVFGFSHYTCE